MHASSPKSMIDLLRMTGERGPILGGSVMLPGTQQRLLGCRADQYFWRALLSRKLLQGYVTFAVKGNIKLINNLLDFKSKFFYARLVMGEDSWGIPDQRVEKLPKLVFAQPPLVSFEGDLLPLVAKLGDPDTPVMLASSWSGAKKKKKKRALKRPNLSAEEELARKEEADPRTVVTLSPVTIHVAGSDVSPSEAPVELNHLRTMGFSPASPSEGIPITAKKSRSVDFIFIDSPLSLVGPVEPLFLEGAPQMIDPEEEGDPAPASTSFGEPEPFITEGDIASTSTSMGESEPPMRLGALAAIFMKPSLSKNNKEDFWRPFGMEGREPWDAEGHGSAEQMLWELLPHVEYRYPVLRTFLTLTTRDRWLSDWSGVSPNMGADKHLKIIGAGRRPKETGFVHFSKEVFRPNPLPSVWEFLATILSATLSDSQSRAEEELEASLE
ncbi:hypothetical protein ACLOJK_007716 [Asimina triloba]